MKPSAVLLRDEDEEDDGAAVGMASGGQKFSFLEMTLLRMWYRCRGKVERAAAVGRTVDAIDAGSKTLRMGSKASFGCVNAE